MLARTDATHPAAAQTAVAEAVAVSKRFGPTVALSNVSFAIRPGQSHALVGRNGAGKSTLVSIMTGLTVPDDGEVRFGGLPAPSSSDRDGWRRAVACVYQRSTIVPALTVAENLFINRQTQRGLINWPALNRRAQALLQEYGVAVDASRLAGDLDVETRQTVEIARALSIGAKFIILDEPTAQLDGAASTRLFQRMRALQEGGVTFLYISHHLQEIYEVCESVTVLRDARHILTAPVVDIPHEQLVEAMTGEARGTAAAAARQGSAAGAAPVLAVNGLALAGEFSGIDLTVRAGEIVGVAGSGGSGATAFAEALVGLRIPDSGDVRVSGAAVPPGDLPAALQAGIGWVPKDRIKQGIVPLLGLAENATLPIADRLGRYGAIMPRRQRAIAEAMIRRLAIKTDGPDQPAAALSGGNQQKVVMARALSSDPKVLILVDPTVGVDIRSKESLLAAVDDSARAGRAVVMVTDDVDDLRCCDRVVVLYKGRAVREFAAGWADGDLVAAIEGVGVGVSTEMNRAAGAISAAELAPARPGLRLGRLRDFTLIPVIVVLLVIGSFVDPVFLTAENLKNVLQQQTELSLVVLAEAIILIAGKFDLSLESTVGLAPALAVLVINGAFGSPLPSFLAVPLALAIGGAIGWVNGLLILKFRLSAFIVTLGMLIVLRGLQVGFTGGRSLFELPESISSLGIAVWLGIPASIWICLAAYAAGMVILGFFMQGRAVYAVGGNTDAARAAGIRTDRVVWSVLVVGSMLAALAGVLLAGRLGSIAAAQGQGLIFTVFAAAVIGGISLDGGKGTLFGAVCGVLALGLIQNILTLAGVRGEWIGAIYGAIILAALMVARVTSGKAQD